MQQIGLKPNLKLTSLTEFGEHHSSVKRMKADLDQTPQLICIIAGLKTKA
jgi:hypothetical protein